MTNLTWEQALDELEQHLDHAESLLSGATAGELPRRGWVKPDGLGPLPGHLVDRAFSLRERQHAVLAAIPAALAATRQQRTVTERLESGGRQHAPAVYIDVTA
ncbi:MAG TPA: hypothetical protein VNS55_02515 [Nocardioides sp.]|nr:hypothetical protein [Nocardioides sp.]